MHEEFTDKAEESNKHPQNNKPETIINKIPEIKQSDNKFMTKRSKLESLLGNIKNKLTNKDNINHNKVTSKNSEDKKSKAETKTNAETKQITFPTKKIPTGCSKINEHQTNVQCTTLDDTVKSNESIDKRTNNSTSESTDGEDPFSTLRDNDILNDLENMEIPIQEDKKINEIVIVDLEGKDTNNSTKITETFVATDNEEQSNDDFLKKNKSSECDNLNPVKTDRSDNNKHKNELKKYVTDARTETVDKNKTNTNIENKMSHSDDITVKTNPSVHTLCKTALNIEDNSTNKDSDIHKLTITSIEKISSPLSDVDNSSSPEFDRISEINIKFIDEDVSSLNSEYSSSDKNLNEQNCDTKGVDTCKGNVETNSNQNGIIEPTFVQNEKDFESVEKITKFKKHKDKDKEYMTVYKIISCEDVADNQVNVTNVSCVTNDKDFKNIEKSDVFKKIISDNFKPNENTDCVKGNLNSFYKKCKSTYNIKPKSTPNNAESEICKDISIEQENSTEDKSIGHSISSEGEGDCAIETVQTFNHDLETDMFCRSCETSEKSIVISDQNIVKYCLKCSSIFESENCTYCDKKAEMDKKNLQIKNSENTKQSVSSSDVKF